MFVVNFLGSSAVAPDVLRHHGGYAVDGRTHAYVTYADAVMPQFFLAAGFAARLTLLRRLKADGPAVAYRRTVRRCFALLLVALLVHHLDGRYDSWAALRGLGPWGFVTTAFQRDFFQTLTHIAVTTLWVLPVLAAGPRWRVGFAVLSAAVHVALSSQGYYDWVMRRPGIDGGPLGFQTWTVPFLAGSLAYDVVVEFPPTTAAVRLALGGAGLMAG